MLKVKKHMVTLACLVTGMLVLTTSVYANFDDAKGYTNFKEAAKQLVFEETNFTANTDVKVTLDGNVITKMQNQMKMADGNHSMKDKYEYSDGQDTWEVYSYGSGNKSIYYYEENNTYYENTRSQIQKTLIPLDDDQTGMSGGGAKKAVRFMELLADTMVGDLKNNVVLDSADENGTRTYSMNIEGSQIPEVVNAGLSMVFSANSGDYDANSGDISQMYASDARIGSAKCTFSIDKEGRLTAANMEASLVGEDMNGASHESVMTVNATISDYGTTTADVFDPTGKVKAEDRQVEDVVTMETMEAQ